MLDCMISNPDPSTTCCESDMQLWVVSEESCSSASKSRSRVGGFHYLGHVQCCTKPLPRHQNFLNAPIHVEASIIRPAVDAASRAEIAAGHANAREVIPFRITLL